MNPKAILIIAAVAIFGIYSLFFANHPDSEMQDIADEFCDCDSDPCRDEAIAKALKLEDKYGGDTVDESAADGWEQAQNQLLKCVEAAGYGG